LPLHLLSIYINFLLLIFHLDLGFIFFHYIDKKSSHNVLFCFVGRHCRKWRQSILHGIQNSGIFFLYCLCHKRKAISYEGEKNPTRPPWLSI
jgi:hypothetical protein